MAKKISKSLSILVIYLLLIIFSIICIFPIVWMVISALKPITEIRQAIPTLTIKSPTMGNFYRVLFQAGFSKYIRNSFIISLSATVLSLIIAVMAGYGFSRYYKQRLIKISNLTMVISQMIPGVLLLVPLYMTMMKLGLLETPYSLIIAYTTFAVPLCTFMMSSFFDTVPIELEEAAEMDGCSKALIIWKIIIPISLPTLISTGLYAFITSWNEFMFGYVFMSTDKWRTLTPAIMIFKGANLIDWGGLMAGSVVAIIPVGIIFLFIQRYFFAGLMSGSIKG
ncbi:carbohydrate ABC transporter permease [Thermoanaerobacterium thermosaccharolyticum]|uniref:carbohydrate ABC transporter permease n=1 Tax=Thermoanaerobacterium thermosaccharolyticum TaxID=1517 RepID=UPI003DAA05D6